jgi:hypothetical protein
MTRCLEGHAPPEVLLDVKGEMGGELLVELAIAPVQGESAADPSEPGTQGTPFKAGHERLLWEDHTKMRREFEARNPVAL